LLVESFAAATRLGRVPVVRESLDTDTRRDRLFRTLNQRFHRDRWLDPMTPGSLLTQYLDQLDNHLLDLATTARPALQRAAARAAHARAQGHRVYLVVGPHGLPHHAATLQRTTHPNPQAEAERSAASGIPHSTTTTTTTTTPFPYHTLGESEKPSPHDAVLAFADYQHAGAYDFFPQVDRLRKTRRITWLLNAHNTYRHDLRRGERVVDLLTPVGDAAIRVSMYDAPLGPTSGVITLAAFHAITLELTHPDR
ncbi:MAG: hypothetical protein AAF823_13995, partial [Planctomycetota bacterium]